MNNFLRILILSLVSIIFASGHAENFWKTGYRKILVEDTAHTEVIYVHIANDRHLKQQQVKYEMLSIGNDITAYGGHGNYQLDTLFLKKKEIALSPQEMIRLGKEYEPIYESLTINREKGILNFYGNIFINNYKYSEPIPEIDWTLTDETEEIMGHQCHKATARWRGREWNAWYSDIPVDAGPWKFQGLPGLILKVEDTEGDHSIYAIGIENNVIPIGHTYKAYSKATREKYNEAKEDHAINGNKMLINSGMVTAVNGEKPKPVNHRRFYAPLELE
ncbi:MAG: GLPGLI family protein [Muribaculaceae bacterium]|nr:GLPGLI family protein [Muribaculaceae bacterium]